jgi:hypothetical protein
LSNETPPFSPARFGLEIRLIIGIRNATYEFIVNPIVDVGFGRHGEADFAPAARLARRFKADLYAGSEYYSDLGRLGDFQSFAQQQHTLFAVADFKHGVFDVDFGVGYGCTPASDRWVAKAIIGYAFPVPGEGDRAAAVPVNPMAHPSARAMPEQVQHK